METVELYKINVLWLVPSLLKLLQKLSKRLDTQENKRVGSLIKFSFLGTAPISIKEKNLLKKLLVFQYTKIMDSLKLHLFLPRKVMIIKAELTEQ